MTEAIEFQCPNCEAQYKVVRIEAPSADDDALLCLSCDAPLPDREGEFALKYFRTDGPRRRSTRKTSTV
jgi:predicted RNA-binding Zn-ribbon protein involved in translation (DUF1610 family)